MNKAMTKREIREMLHPHLEKDYLPNEEKFVLLFNNNFIRFLV